MSQILEDSPAKSVRKSARSCIQCRSRKVRCIWLEGAGTCQSCSSRGRTCELQIRKKPTSETVRETSRARIQRLESDVSRLWAVVRNLEAHTGHVPTEPAIWPPDLPQTESTDGHHNKPSDDDSDSDASPTGTPSHLLQLFDNGLLDCSGEGCDPPSRGVKSSHQVGKSSELRHLLPSREDMSTIKTYASWWLSMQNALFPSINLIETGEEMMLQYDLLQDPNTDLVTLANYLLSVAITVQQGGAVESIRDVSSFVRAVSDTVERIVISDDVLSGTLEGIETVLLFLRLQLGRASVRKMWLLTRRAVALAELIGLPRASMAMVSHEETMTGTFGGARPEVSALQIEFWKRKAGVWESLCAVDRISSMMWSLPLATSNYSLPKRPIVDSQGQVNPHAYMFSIANIASRILEMDSIHSSGRPLTELFNAVIATDQELRSLASLTPKTWWEINPELELSINSVLQFWHHYLTVRTHLQLALKYDDGQEFVFSFITCLNACQELARRYLSLRPVLPAGYFANRVIDLQVFTATVFLLLASYRKFRGPNTFLQTVDVNAAKGIVDLVVRTMGFAADRAGGDFARQAADSIRSLSLLLQQPQTSEAQKITLNLALIGRLHVSRHPHAAKNMPKQSHLTPNEQAPAPWQTPPVSIDTASATQEFSIEPSDLESIDSFSYSMEIPENFPLLNNDTFGTEQWLTWTGWDGNS